MARKQASRRAVHRRSSAGDGRRTRGTPACDGTTAAEAHGTAELPRRPLVDVSYPVRLFGVTAGRVYELVASGRLPGVVRLGRQIRFDPDKLDAFVAAGGQGLEGGWRRESAD